MPQGESKLMGLIIGQPVVPEKVQQARRFRQEMTAEESLLWQKLRGSRLGANFRRQQIVFGFIADFYCNTARLGVEIDSPSHDKEYDAERDRIFAQHGILVLRFTNEQVMLDLPNVLREIRRVLRMRLNNVPSSE